MTWQPIETAPKDGTDILAVNAFGAHCIVYWEPSIGKGRWQPASRQWGSFQATHWMPLPEPPE